MRTVPPSRLALPVCVPCNSTSMARSTSRLSARQAIEQRLIVLDDPGTAVGAQLVRAFPPRDREDAPSTDAK